MTLLLQEFLGMEHLFECIQYVCVCVCVCVFVRSYLKLEGRDKTHSIHFPTRLETKVLSVLSVSLSEFAF